MGVAFKRDCIAVAVRDQVWFHRSAPDIAPRLEPAGEHDACYLARTAHVTGEIQSHEMHWSGERLWIVNTLFSCLCTPHPAYSFVPLWRPPFISALAAENRCHLNGLALENGIPRYVTALAETDTRQGWRQDKVHSGCLIDVASGRTVARGFAMPHSPRVRTATQGAQAKDGVWLLDSGRGRLVQVDPADGGIRTVAQLSGFARGLAFHGPLAFVGLSKIRETSTFGGMPIAEQRESLQCGVVAVELSSGQVVASFLFQSGVEEIFDVTVLPGMRTPAFRGPHSVDDGVATVWVVPPETRDVPDAPSESALETL